MYTDRRLIFSAVYFYIRAEILQNSRPEKFSVEKIITKCLKFMRENYCTLKNNML